MNIPFSVYDFFAYLSSGAVVLATADYIWQFGILSRKEVGPVLAAFLIILAYTAGQIIAHFSAWLLEHTVVARLLKRPTTILLGGAPTAKLLKWTFPSYHRALPANVQARVRAQAANMNCDAEGEALFLHMYPLVTKTERFQLRLDKFRDLYGFARNMSFAFLIAGASILVAHWRNPQSVRISLAILAILASVTLFYRYLKFFQQYSYELLLRYAEL